MIPCADDLRFTCRGKTTNGSYGYVTVTETRDPMVLPGSVVGSDEARYWTETWASSRSAVLRIPALAKFLITVRTWLGSAAPLAPSAPDPPDLWPPCTIA